MPSPRRVSPTSRDAAHRNGTATAPAASVSNREGERLSKRVMALRQCSRSEAERYIEGGFVTVDGAVVESPQHRVKLQTVQIASDASLLNLAPVTLLLHKPAAYPKPGTLLQRQSHWVHDPNARVLQRHLNHPMDCVSLEPEASGLLVFTQDWRIQRKLTQDAAIIEHELMLEVGGSLEPETLTRLERALYDPARRLPAAKISLNSSRPECSRLRLAVKGAHPGLAAHLCELANLKLLALHRIRVGRVFLAGLPEGQWRFLGAAERF